MSPPELPSPNEPAEPSQEPEGIPHVVFGIGAVVTLILAALVLIVLSGHVPHHPGAIMVLLFGVPGLAALVVLGTKRWRAARSTGA